jgi:hypothetical protein
MGAGIGTDSFDQAPTSEIGRGVSSVYEFTGLLPWGQWQDDVEKAPDLQWPKSVQIYDQMRNDSQCQGLYLGATAAIQRYIWYLDPNDCPTQWVNLLAADLNLPVGLDAAKQAHESGQKRGALRTDNRFSWYNHLRDALKAMYYGYYYFEQSGEIVFDGPGGRQRWQLRKLAPRHPRTITEIWVGEDGGLLFVKQGYGLGAREARMLGMSVGAPEIPIDRMVCYVWDQEPGNWVGRSIFRPMYRNYLIKDRLLRVDAIKHERNGVGMPIVEAPEGASGPQIQELDRMAQEYKVGERGGGALPYGAKLTLQGTQGALPDTIASMRFQNEEMARSLLMMFFQLGQTDTGSRALGESFIDWFSLQQEMIADWIVSVDNPHLIGDWWRWNVDDQTDHFPLLAYHKDDSSQVRMNDFRGADMPQELQPQTQASRARLPRRASSSPGARAGMPSLPVGGAVGSNNGNETLEPPGLVALAPAAPAFPWIEQQPAWPYRRQLYEHELQASMSPQQLDELFGTAIDEVVHYWMTAVRPAQLAEINANLSQVRTTDLERLVRVSASPLGAEELFARLKVAAQEAVAEATREVVSQGQPPPTVNWDEIDTDLRSRATAMADVMASELGDAAGRTALRRTSDVITSQTLADEVTDELSQASESSISDRLAGTVQAAVNTGRLAVYDSTEQQPELFASEILDRNTCRNCIQVDGLKLTREDAARLYASGGYINCLGRDRCRGTVVATYSTGVFP